MVGVEKEEEGEEEEVEKKRGHSKNKKHLPSSSQAKSTLFSYLVRAHAAPCRSGTRGTSCLLSGEAREAREGMRKREDLLFCR